jgi:hypothetical protein
MIIISRAGTKRRMMIGTSGAQLLHAYTVLRSHARICARNPTYHVQSNRLTLQQ